MKTKDFVLKKLQDAEDYLSGERLAKDLDLSRAAVWQAIAALRKDGFHIDAVTNRGYLLVKDFEALDEAAMRPYLKEDLKHIDIFVEESIDSTNDALFRKDDEHALPSFSFMLAEEQTAGKGRVGKSFLSPYGTGLYLSTIIKPTEQAISANTLTMAAAVAAIDALKKQTDADIRIKWVNDLYLDHKKIAGILTEADFKPEHIRYVVGIGINIKTEQTLFEKKDLPRAGSLARDLLRNQLAADFINAFAARLQNNEKTLLSDYRKYNLTIGKTITFQQGDIQQQGVVTAIDDHGHLIVNCGENTVTLTAGAISIEGEW